MYKLAIQDWGSRSALSGSLAGRLRLDWSGLMSHEVESPITAEPNWLVGEIKTCYSFGSGRRYFRPDICDTGRYWVSDRRMKITHGREKQTGVRGRYLELYAHTR